MNSPNSKLAAAKSVNSDILNVKSTAKQDCSDIINISVFFDGTGNNKYADEASKRWSNPARLWHATQYLANYTTNHAIYVSGVGTTFNGAPPTWESQRDILVEDEAFGNAAGGGGTRRLQYGQDQVNDALRRALLANAKKFNAATRAYAAKNGAEKLSEIAKTLKQFKLVTVINLSIFGFSRGAALARAFVNNFLGCCEVLDDGRIFFNHQPVRIRFLGLFDTVASFGLPSQNIDTPFDEKNLVVPDAVERCVHLVASHELRFSFPVDLIRKNGKYNPNWIEIPFPGVHSDVGGGYEPVAQGISNNYARIPMRRMMHEAHLAGVRLISYDEIRHFEILLFNEQYLVLPETESRFRKYMKAVQPSGTVEQAVAAHMAALYSGFGTMTRRKIETPDLVAAKGSMTYKAVGHMGIAEEAEQFLGPSKSAGTIAKTSTTNDSLRTLTTVRAKIYRQFVRPEAWRLQAWQTNCSDAVLDFIRHSVHDSKAGFIYSIEPFSYFRPRGMAESSRNVLASGLDWLDDRAADAKDGLIKIYHGAKGVIVETWEFHKLVATKTYNVGEKFFVETVQAGEKYSVQVIQGGKEVFISTMEKGERMFITSVETAKEQAVALAEDTQRSASILAGEVGYESAQLSRQIKSGASQAVDGAGKLVDAGVKMIDDIWTATRSELGL